MTNRKKKKKGKHVNTFAWNVPDTDSSSFLPVRTKAAMLRQEFSGLCLMASETKEALAQAVDDVPVPCGFRQLKDTLAVLRKPEDNAPLRLGRTRSRYDQHGFVDCQRLWEEFATIRAYRLRHIDRCRRQKQEELSAMSHSDPGRGTLASEIGFLETELLYESILKDQTAKLFEIQCPGLKV